MSISMELNEATAARRRVPCRLFTSDGTSPDTGALNDAVIMGVNSLTTISLTSTLRAVNAAHGMYCVELTQSETSVLGTHPLYHTVGDFPQHIATIQVVNANPFSTQSNLNLSSLTVLGTTRLDSSVTLRAVVHSGATIKGIENFANISSVTLNAGTHSGATVQGLTRALNLSANDDKTGYSISGTKTTLDALNDITGSAVTLHAGTHSNVTIQGVTRVNSGVTLNANTHSGATIAGITAGGIVAATFAAGAIDAVALATDAGQEIADRILLRSIEGGADSGRSVGQALAPLRNKTAISGVTLTVYGADDTTAMWTASVTTGADPLSGIDPA